MRALGMLALALCVVVDPAFARTPTDVVFTVTRKRMDASKERERSNTTLEEREIVYVIRATPRSFKPLEGVTIAYNIFRETPVFGKDGKAPVETHSGSQTFDTLVNNKPVEFETKPIKLSEKTLDGGWYFTSGASNVAKDRVLGAWVKATDSSGKLLGEYCNPSTLAAKYPWVAPR